MGRAFQLSLLQIRCGNRLPYGEMGNDWWHTQGVQDHLLHFLLRLVKRLQPWVNVLQIHEVWVIRFL